MTLPLPNAKCQRHFLPFCHLNDDDVWNCQPKNRWLGPPAPAPGDPPLRGGQSELEPETERRAVTQALPQHQCAPSNVNDINVLADESA
jgi:hypothetical protein